MADCKLANPEGVVLDTSSIDVSQRFELLRPRAEGEIRIAGARVDGQLRIDDAELMNPSGVVLNAENTSVQRGLFLRRAQAAGQVRVLGARIGGQLLLHDSRIANPDRRAVLGDGAQIGGGVSTRNLSVAGEFGLLKADIAGHLDLAGVHAENAGGTALNLSGVRAAEMWLPEIPPRGVVNLRGARVGTLQNAHDIARRQVDSGELYDVRLDGFVEESVGDLGLRVKWIEDVRERYAPHLYDQLENALRDAGREKEARDVVIRKNRRKRQVLRPPAKVGNYSLNGRWVTAIELGVRATPYSL